MRKKILILGHNYATQFVDIYNQYTCLFAKEEFEVTVAFLTGKPSEEVKARMLAEEVLFLQLPKKSLRALKINAIKKLLTICRENQFQMVICHRYKPAYIMMWVAQFCVIPRLFLVMHELKTMSSLNRRLLIAAIGRKNMAFAGVSNAVRDDIRKSLWRIPQERIITLYNMIDIERTEPEFFSAQTARKMLGIAEDAFLFGNVARLAPNKDQASLIHAFSLIKPYCANIKLVLIGNGPLEAQLKQQVSAYGLNNDVIFTGYLSGGFRYMKAFDCFILSSIQEAFGRVLLEAMTAKIPIIASKVHGIPEVIEDAGLLVKAKDPLSFAEAMKKVYLLPKKEKQTLGEKGYQRAISHFSIPRFKENFWQLSFVNNLSE